MLIIIYALLIFVIVGSIFAVETQNLLSAVISVGVVGYGLSILFLILGAPDIAIVQIIVEIIFLVLLIRATVSMDNLDIPKRGEIFSNIIGLIFFGLFLVFAYFAYKEMPDFGDATMRVSKEYLKSGIEQTGSANYVTSIILDFRAYDTLGEVTVLFTSVLGAYTVLRRKCRKKIAEPDIED